MQTLVVSMIPLPQVTEHSDQGVKSVQTSKKHFRALIFPFFPSAMSKPFVCQKCIIILLAIVLPGQTSMLQFLCSSVRPSHVPPRQIRDLDCTPPPHVALHTPQSDHSLIIPTINMGVGDLLFALSFMFALAVWLSDLLYTFSPSKLLLCLSFTD